MNNFDAIRKLAKTDNIVNYIEDGICNMRAEEESGYRKADEKCEDLFDTIDKIYNTDSRENIGICAAVSDFYSACQNIYFKAGLLSGFYISKNINSDYLKLSEDEIMKLMIKKVTTQIENEYK